METDEARPSVLSVGFFSIVYTQPSLNLIIALPFLVPPKLYTPLSHPLYSWYPEYSYSPFGALKLKAEIGG